jgi:multiple sugar transport system ATP-binding protein
MNGGRLQQADSPEAIYVRPVNLFVAGFIGSPKMNLVPGRVGSADGRPAVEFLGQTVALDGALAQAVGALGHDEVVVGLRAEDIRLADDAPASYSARLQGVVDVWEPLGSETYVRLKMGESTVTARFPPRTAVASGDVAQVAFTPSHLHVFDARTERNVLAGLPAPAPAAAVAQPA